MPVTLEQAKQNAATDLDLAAIDEFRKNTLLDRMVFHDAVNPVGGGGTLTYGYRRVITRSGAGFRAINSEYAPTEATTAPYSTELKPLGGSFQIDRVLARVGPAASGEVAFQMGQKIASTQDEFADAVINGDVATDEDGFDGLSKALAGSDTEIEDGFDWSAGMTEDNSFTVLENLDELLALLDGVPTVVLSNKAVIAKAAAAARRSSAYTVVPSPIPGGQPAWSYNGITFLDPGKKPGTNADIIPLTGGAADLYAVRIALDGFHGVSMSGAPLVQTWAPDFSDAGAVKTGEVEMGPVSVALKKTKAAAVVRGVTVRA